MKPFYVTTPIYYVNDRPHIGHTYTTVLADVLARYHRMLGEDVYFLTGTDEHGQKIEKTAAARGITPRQLVEEVAPNFSDLWKQMDMTHDHFVRTTDEAHREVVQARFRQLLASGDIYRATYKGLYSVSDEAYVTETQAKEMQAQGLAHQLVELEEESYFFRLSAYEHWLHQLYAQRPEFVRPDFRLNEVKRFTEGGLADLSISRTSITWGIPVPDDPKHVIYVWFDALLNYLSACREGQWPPTVQLVGKDILRFHAIYWPAFLMAMIRKPEDDLAGPLPAHVDAWLPRTILAHGWWLMGDDKMSKSKGNVVRPGQLLHFGNDAMRYFFLREMQIGYDRSFTFEGFMDRLNADLANGLGNLAARSISMIQKYRGGSLEELKRLDWETLKNEPTTVEGEDWKRTLQPHYGVFADWNCLPADYLHLVAENHITEALEKLWAGLRALDSFIVLVEPWKLAKIEANDEYARLRMNYALAILWRALRVTSYLIAPIMPAMAQDLWNQLGQPGKVADQVIGTTGTNQQGLQETTSHVDFLDPITADRVLDPKPLFARIDKEAEMKTFEEAAAPAAPIAPGLDVPELRETTDYDTFSRTDLRVGQVLEAERVPKSDKLIKMKVDLGFEQRTIVGGIGKAYTPEELVGRRVVVVANLAPRKLMGVESHGMLLAASDNNSKPYLLSVGEEALPGYIVK